jgi:hypothetical protein
VLLLAVQTELELGLLGGRLELLLGVFEDEETAVFRLEEEVSVLEKLEYLWCASFSLGNSRLGLSAQDKKMANPKVASATCLFLIVCSPFPFLFYPTKPLGGKAWQVRATIGANSFSAAHLILYATHGI